MIWQPCGATWSSLRGRKPVAMLLGPLIFRHVFSRKAGHEGPRDLEVQVADAFLRAFGTQS